MSSGRRVIPALGLAWANCVNTRIFLTRKQEVTIGKKNQRKKKRMKMWNEIEAEKKQQSCILAHPLCFASF